MKKSSGLDFTHKPQKRSSGALVAAIAVGVLIIGAVSFIILLAVNDFDTAKFLGMRISDETAAQNTTQTDESEISETAPEFSDTDAVNFLFVCHNSAELSFCSVLSASVKENSLKIKAIAPDMTAQINGEKTTGAEAFRRALAEVCLCKVFAHHRCLGKCLKRRQPVARVAVFNEL